MSQFQIVCTFCWQIVSRVLYGVVLQEGGLPARKAARMAALPGGREFLLPLPWRERAGVRGKKQTDHYPPLTSLLLSVDNPRTG